MRVSLSTAVHIRSDRWLHWWLQSRCALLLVLFRFCQILGFSQVPNGTLLEAVVLLLVPQEVNGMA